MGTTDKIPLGASWALRHLSSSYDLVAVPSWFCCRTTSWRRHEEDSRMTERARVFRKFKDRPSDVYLVHPAIIYVRHDNICQKKDLLTFEQIYNFKNILSSLTYPKWLCHIFMGNVLTTRPFVTTRCKTLPDSTSIYVMKPVTHGEEGSCENS